MLADGLHDVPAGKVAMVVTHLEMREKAPLRPLDAPPGTRFDRVSPDPASYRDLFSRVGSNWLWYSRLTWDDDRLRAVLEDANVEHFVLQRAGRAEAMLELDFRTEGQCELAYFGLAPALIGCGAGRYLMNRAIELAWARPITRFHVHTCNLDSPLALAFYIRSGFVPYKRQVEIDDDPRLRGILPESAAPHVPLIRP